jgi:hypothetical protein
MASRVRRSRLALENALWRRLVKEYASNPNALGECQPLKNAACFNGLDLGSIL